MEPKEKLMEDTAWKQLEEFYFGTGSRINIADLFRQDPQRFEKFRYSSYFLFFHIK